MSHQQFYETVQRQEEYEMDYIRIVSPNELVREVIRDAKEHGAHLYINYETKQAIISSSNLVGFERARPDAYRVSDIGVAA